MREKYNNGTTLTKEQWIEVLTNKSITNDVNIKILTIIYSFHEHQASSGQIGLLMRYNGTSKSSPVNLEIGRWGKKVAKKYSLKLSKRNEKEERKWDIFFDGYSTKDRFIWKIKSELVQALEQLNFVSNELLSEEIPENQIKGLFEGTKKSIIVNSYERNKQAKIVCVDFHGVNCKCCGMNFEQIYGEIGKGFIEVHHLTPLSEINNAYEINPVTMLVPVCPNCHAMLHKKTLPYTIEELKEIINNNRKE